MSKKSLSSRYTHNKQKVKGKKTASGLSINMILTISGRRPVAILHRRGLPHWSAGPSDEGTTIQFSYGTIQRA